MKLIDKKEVEKAALDCCMRDGYSDTYAAGKISGFSEGASFAEQKLQPMMIEFAEWWQKNVFKADFPDHYCIKGQFTVCYEKEQLLEQFLKTKQK